MAIIKKKIRADYFEEILSGKKKFELRLNDFNVKEGDILIVQEHDSAHNLTGREIEKKVTYVHKFKVQDLYWPPDEIADEGLQIITFE